MSAHAETSHGHESVHGSESAMETLFEGISKIFSSVRIAIGKVYTGFKNILSDLTNTFKNHPVSNAAHATPDVHATPKVHEAPETHASPTPEAKHEEAAHAAEAKKEGHH